MLFIVVNQNCNDNAKKVYIFKKKHWKLTTPTMFESQISMQNETEFMLVGMDELSSNHADWHTLSCAFIWIVNLRNIQHARKIIKIHHPNLAIQISLYSIFACIASISLIHFVSIIKTFCDAS